MPRLTAKYNHSVFLIVTESLRVKAQKHTPLTFLFLRKNRKFKGWLGSEPEVHLLI